MLVWIPPFRFKRHKTQKLENTRLQNNNQKAFYHFMQCSGSGSTCFLTSQIRIRIHQSEVWIRIRILPSSCKNSKKNLDSFYFVTHFDFLSLKNDVNVPSKSNTQKKKVFLLASWRSMTKIAGSGSGSTSQKHGSEDPDPDLPQNVMDPEHCFYEQHLWSNLVKKTNTTQELMTNKYGIWQNFTRIRTQIAVKWRPIEKKI